MDLALPQHADLVGHGEGFQLIVRDQDGGHPLALQNLAHLARQLLAQLRVHAGERLIQKQDRRTRRHGPRQRHPLLHAARELMRILAGGRLQTNQFQQFADAGGALAAREVPQPEADVAFHRQMRKEREILEHHADALRLRRSGPSRACLIGRNRRS